MRFTEPCFRNGCLFYNVRLSRKSTAEIARLTWVWQPSTWMSQVQQFSKNGTISVHFRVYVPKSSRFPFKTICKIRYQGQKFKSNVPKIMTVYYKDSQQYTEWLNYRAIYKTYTVEPRYFEVPREIEKSSKQQGFEITGEA